MLLVKKYFGVLMILCAALIWGVSFVAQSSAADNITTFTFNTARFTLATVFLLVIIGIRAIILKAKGLPQIKLTKKTVIGGIATGVAMFFAANLQQFGIEAYPVGVPSSGRAGFITATYVVMIAIVSLIKTKHMRINVILSVAGCLGGMYMLCFSNGIEGLYLGDLLVFLCAVCYTVHVMAIDYFNKQDGLYVSFVQFVVASIITAIAMAIFEEPKIEMITSSLVPVLYTGILSCGVAYTLQIIGQKTAEPTVASIVMSLESVFAALAGWIILKEQLSPIEICGCVLVFLSVVFAQIEFKKKEKKPHITEEK